MIACDDDNCEYGWVRCITQILSVDLLMAMFIVPHGVFGDVQSTGWRLVLFCVSGRPGSECCRLSGKVFCARSQETLMGYTVH